MIGGGRYQPAAWLRRLVYLPTRGSPTLWWPEAFAFGLAFSHCEGMKCVCFTFLLRSCPLSGNGRLIDSPPLPSLL